MYKRNQISEALVKAVRASSSSLDDSAILIRVKRLLDTDRKPPASINSLSSFAFFDAESAGSGRDVTFSAYSAFALLIAFRLMSCGLKQSKAVFALRFFRAALEQEHERMSKIEVAPLLKIRGTVIAGANAIGREQHFAKGNVVERLTDMVFFAFTPI